MLDARFLRAHGGTPSPQRGEGGGEGDQGSIVCNPSPHPSPYGTGSRPCPWHRIALLPDLPDLEPGRAFELALGQLRRQMRIGPALAWLAEEVDAQQDLALVALVIQLAALLDEQRADRALAFGGR